MQYPPTVSQCQCIVLFFYHCQFGIIFGRRILDGGILIYVVSRLVLGASLGLCGAPGRGAGESGASGVYLVAISCKKASTSLTKSIMTDDRIELSIVLKLCIARNLHALFHSL